MQYAEFDYIVWPWFVPGVRSEFTDAQVAGAADAQLLRLVPGIAMLARPNIKILLTGDLEWGKNLPADRNLVGLRRRSRQLGQHDQVRSRTDQRDRGRGLLSGDPDMNTKRLLTLLALTTLGPLASLACEGEPPVMAPENPSGSAGGAEVVVASAAPSQEPEAPPPAQTVCPPPPCTPVGSGAAVAVAAPPASGSASGEPPALPVPPTSVPRGNILGVITTKPAGLRRRPSSTSRTGRPRTPPRAARPSPSRTAR